MRRAMLLSIVVVFMASFAFGQAGLVGVYTDQTGTDCELVDAGAPGLITYWVVHTATAEASAIQFVAPQPACMVGASWLSDTAQFPVTIGDSQVGVAIGYGVCLAEPIACLAINFFAAGTSTACCPYPVLPDPLVPSGEIEVVDCDDNLIFATGLTSVINADATCPCPPVSQCLSDGDVNNSTHLSAVDALCAYNIALSAGQVTADCDVPNWDCEVDASDVNCDVTVTAGDALDIFDRSLLDGVPEDCFAAVPFGQMASARLERGLYDVSFDKATVVGDELVLPVMMRAIRGGAAFGFEIHYDPEDLVYESIAVGDVAAHWMGLDARELEPGRVRSMGFDGDGLKAAELPAGDMVQIAELRFRKLHDDAKLGSVEWIEQRIDAEPGDEPQDTPDRVTKLDLSRPYPNPFRDGVTADVFVPSDEAHSVRVAVYDVKGRLVATLLNRSVSGGTQAVTWDRRTSGGELVPSGIYFMRMEVKESGFAQTRKLVVLK